MSKQSNLHTFNIEGSAKRYLSGELRFIETFTVHNLSKKFFIPNLIRMDVEGHECQIISGMLKYIKKGIFKPHICFEPHITSILKIIIFRLHSLSYSSLVITLICYHQRSKWN